MDTTSTGPQAWATSDLDVVGEYLAAQKAASDYARRINNAAVTFGGALGAAQARSTEGSALIGLIPVDHTRPPPGWKYSARARCFTPATGTRGRDARAWLKDNQPPRESRAVLTAYGLPPNDLTGERRGGSVVIRTPVVGVHDGTVWALYEGEPGDWMTGPRPPGELWKQRPVSEFWAAAEARARMLAALQTA